MCPALSKSQELKEAMARFRELKEEYDGSLKKRLESSRCRTAFEQGKIEVALADDIKLEREFERALPNSSILTIKNDLINQMIIGEDATYHLINMLLNHIGAGYRTSFVYTGRCPKCDWEKEVETIVHSPVLDYEFINNPHVQNLFLDQLRCGLTAGKKAKVVCLEETVPVKTCNFFYLDKNGYGIDFMRARRKSEARTITKAVQVCSGRRKGIRDMLGIMIVTASEDDCRNGGTQELLIGYHGNGRELLHCKDYFENKEYDLYLKETRKGSALRRTNEIPLKPLERGRKSYRAIHEDFEYNKVLMELQLKAIGMWEEETNSNSPLFHGQYSKQRPERREHYEERQEREIRKDWGEFERRLERFLERTRIFGKYHPGLYIANPYG